MNKLVVYICFLLITSTAFCQRVKNTVSISNNEKLESFKSQYKAGNRDISFIKEYVDFLEGGNIVNANNNFAFMLQGYRNPETKKLVLDYVSKCPVRQISEKDVWELARYYLLDDVYSNAFEYVHNRLDKFKWGKIDSRYSIVRDLDNKISSEVLKIAGPHKDSEGCFQMPRYNEEKFARIQSMVNRGVINRASELKVIFSIYNNFSLDDHEKMFSILEYGIELKLFHRNEQYVSSVLGYLADHSGNKKILSNCLEMLNGFIKNDEKSDGLGYNYYDVVSKLYAKLGDSSKSLEAKKRYDAIEAMKVERFGGLINLLNKKK